MSSFLYIHILNCILIIRYQVNDEIALKLDTLNSYVFEIKFCFISVFQFLSNYTECLTNDLVTGLGMVVAIPMCGGRFKLLKFQLSIFNIIYMYIQSCVKYLLELFIFVNFEKKTTLKWASTEQIKKYYNFWKVYKLNQI